jgi:hypothetical protein
VTAIEATPLDTPDTLVTCVCLNSPACDWTDKLPSGQVVPERHV